MLASPAEIKALWGHLTPAEREELDAIIAADMAETIWVPLPGPQTMALESKADIVGYGGAAGGGKGLALDTPLPTPTGWTTMGAVVVGDTLLDEAGRPCAVTAVSDVAHRSCYRLTFDDGSTLVADDVHRWVTFDAKELAALTRHDPEWRAARRLARPSRATGRRSAAFSAAVSARNTARAQAGDVSPPPAGTLRDTAQLAATLRTAAGRNNHAIPVSAALDLPEADLPIPPYTLGAWLGDGSARNGQLTGVDAYIWERIEADGFEVRHYRWNSQAHSIIGLMVRLRDLGVLGNKHIPRVYLRASQAQRLALLQGLMDTGGHAALDGGCEFDNTNLALAQGVRELVSSLGIKSTLRAGVAKLDGRVVGPKWRVRFTTSVAVFGMPRKAERLKTKTRRTAQFRYLVACEPIDSVPTRCIAVDSPTRQYLAGATMVPTHNTDLIAGLVTTRHERSLVVRREKAQTEGVIQRLTELLDGTDGFNSQKSIWRLPNGGMVEFAGLDNPGDERRWQGRPHDLKAYDEVTEMREAQVRFVMGWLRTNQAIRSRVLMTFNPPTTQEGRWVLEFFAPWLDPKHPRPAAPGELRWFTTVGGRDEEVPDGRPFVLTGGARLYDFDPDHYAPEDVINPKSRTFIPARLTDNPYLMATGYMSQLQALPEPLRSQMLYGDFRAGIGEDPWQVIPTAWVEAAMERWKDRSPKGEMLALGVDVARGGKDNTVISARHANPDGKGVWFDKLKVHPGTDTPNGPVVAGLTVAERRDDAPIHIDVIGVGASPYDVLQGMGLQTLGINVSEKAVGTDQSGRLRFLNQRSELWWRMREALDPANDRGVALPPDLELKAELCTPKWSVQGPVIKVQSRDEIWESIKRSVDRATAVILANIDTPKRPKRMGSTRPGASREHDPYAALFERDS
jgi:hypothetical protein